MALNGSSCLLPLDSVKLGRLVNSEKNPIQDYHDPSALPVLEPIVNELCVTAPFRATTELQFSTTDPIKTYQLDKYSAVFANVKDLETTTKWMESTIGDNFYLVGYQTVMDASVVYLEEKTRFDAPGENVFAVQYRVLQNPS